MSSPVASQNNPTEAVNSQSPFLWIVVGCSAGAAALFIAFIVVLVYFRHRKSVQDPDDPSDKRSESQPSTGSEEGYPHLARRPPLCHSTSIDVPSLHVTSECVQPRQLHRWHTVGCPYDPISLGAVQPDLYKGSDDEHGTEVPNTNGRLWFSLSLDQESLEVTLIKAKYLTGRGFSNSPRDPFVKIYLLPDEENFQQSKVKRRTLSPKFQETFTFQVAKEELPQKAVRFSVYDIDRKKVRHCLGHVVFPLAQMTPNEVLCRDLKNMSQQSTSLGGLQISLSCNHLSNRIKSTVCRLRDVRGIEAEEAAFYVKVQLFHGRKLMKTKRTTPRPLEHREGVVTFEENFSFAISGRYYDSCSLTFTAMVVGPLVKDEPYGNVVIGPFMYSRGEQLLHWQEMLSNPRIMVTRWHSLEAMHKLS